MPKQIYNLGRTVGMSAWEIYVRQSLLLQPDIEPLSEREWLSESIGMGTSMLLKISKNDTNNVEGVHHIDYVLPQESSLCAPNTIVGSFFFGDADTLDNSDWCKRVTNYGTGLANDAISNPGNSTRYAKSLKTQKLDNVSDVIQRRLLQYIKIQDAIVLQDGKWFDPNQSGDSPSIPSSKEYVPSFWLKPNESAENIKSFVPTNWENLNQADTESKSFIRNTWLGLGESHNQTSNQDLASSNSNTFKPAKSFIPDITRPATIRIIFQDKIEEDFYLLLTGFVTRAIIKGEVGFEIGSVIPDIPADEGMYHPENGDFLGPELYPWASKIVFTYPAILQYLIRNGLKSNNDHLLIEKDPNSVDTNFKLSNIIAGKGVQIIDSPPIIDDNPNNIKVSAEIITPLHGESNTNPYIHVNQNEGRPTELILSKPQAGSGIGITPPTTSGEQYIIGSKIGIVSKKDHTNYDGENYLGVEYSKAATAEDIATKLKPSYPKSGLGIGITPPSEPGSSYIISSKISVPEDRSNYLKVNQVENKLSEDVTTTLTPAIPRNGQGVTVSPPSDTDNTYTINAKMVTTGCGKNYLGIIQSNNNNPIDNISTSLKPSRILPEKGIAITQPDTPGGDIIISSKIATNQTSNARNYIKVSQISSSTLCGSDCNCTDVENTKGHSEICTELTPSFIRSGRYLSITQPNSPGDDIIIKCNLRAGLGINIREDNGDYTINANITVANNNTKVSDTVKDNNGKDVPIVGNNEMSKFLHIQQPKEYGESVVLFPTIIIPGVGISTSFDPVTRQLTINNTQLTSSMKNLTYSTHYDMGFYSAFYACPENMEFATPKMYENGVVSQDHEPITGSNLAEKQKNFRECYIFGNKGTRHPWDAKYIDPKTLKGATHGVNYVHWASKGYGNVYNRNEILPTANQKTNNINENGVLVEDYKGNRRGWLQLECDLNISNNVLLGGSFKISTGGSNMLSYGYNLFDSNMFKFKHGESIEDRPQSRIFWFQFKGTYKGIDLSQLNDNSIFDFIDTSGTTSGIWNVGRPYNESDSNPDKYPDANKKYECIDVNIDNAQDCTIKSCGKSWNINCNLVRLAPGHPLYRDPKDSTDTKCIFVCYGSQLPDGYNTEFSSNRYELGNNIEIKKLYATGINLSQSFTLIRKSGR